MAKTSFNRRNFLKISSAGALGGLVAGKTSAVGPTSYKEPAEEKKNFIYRELGNSGIKLPIVSLGVMRVDNPNLVKAALDKGITHLDTAHGYQGGENEKMLGKILQNYERDRFVIATKIKPPGWNWDKKTLNKEKATKEAYIKDFNISLERLQLNYVDIVYTHAVQNPEIVHHPPFIEALNQLKEEGKIRLAGISTHENEPEIIDAMIKSNAYDVVLTAYNFKKNEEVPIQQAIQRASNANLGVIAMKTMAGGYIDKEEQKKVNAKAALKWALQDKNVHTSIPGCTTFDQLEDNLEVMQDLEMTPEELEDVNRDSQRASLYCPGCDKCLPECPKGLNIPDAMRAYMYTYGYKDLRLAQETLEEAGIPDHACDDCNVCTVNCPSGFDVADRIRDVKRVRHIPKEFIT